MTLIYHPPNLSQLGDVRTSGLLVRGTDLTKNFEHEVPPKSEDDPETISRYKKAVSLYRAKVKELGNLTVERFDRNIP